MDFLLLSKSTMPIIQWIAQLLGWIMNFIYDVLDKIGIPNIGLTIIIYTIFVYLCMTPIQIKQQKTSKMMNIIQPELKQVQDKYKGRRDQASQMKMQAETQEIYNKYGVSPMGSCLPMVIQLPLLFALYQVIYHVPGYVHKVYDIFSGLAEKIINTTGSLDIVTQFISDNKISSRVGDIVDTNKVIDFLYLLKPAQWEKLADVEAFSSFKGLIMETAQKSADVNTFAGINISESPWDCIKSGMANGSFLLVFAAILVPVLAWFTQWLNYKLMPQQVTSTPGASDNMANSMKSMNLFMPVFSAFLCVTFSFGIGIYWIAGAVIRCIQQVVINRRIAKMDADALIKQAQEKRAKKMAKSGIPENKITSQAKTNVKKIQDPKYTKQTDKDSSTYYEKAKNARPDSITARANMVGKFDEKNSKKKK